MPYGQIVIQQKYLRQKCLHWKYQTHCNWFLSFYFHAPSVCSYSSHAEYKLDTIFCLFKTLRQLLLGIKFRVLLACKSPHDPSLFGLTDPISFHLSPSLLRSRRRLFLNMPSRSLPQGPLLRLISFCWERASWSYFPYCSLIPPRSGLPWPVCLQVSSHHQSVSLLNFIFFNLWSFAFVSHFRPWVCETIKHHRASIWAPSLAALSRHLE